MGNNFLYDISGREITAIRILNAPPEWVWKAWTEPEITARWWGPDGFTSTIQRMDVQPGGSWDYILRGPDGTSYTNKAVYAEVLKPERIVYDQGPAPKFRVTVTLQDRNERTDLAFRMFFGTAEAREKVVQLFGGEEGLNRVFDRLAALLAGMRRTGPPKKV